MSKESLDWPYKSCEPCPFEKKVIETVEKELQSIVRDGIKARIEIGCKPNKKGESRMYYSIQEKKKKLTIPVHAGTIGPIICPRLLHRVCLIQKYSRNIRHE